MANERYNFKYLPLVGKLPGKSMVEQTETAINELASVVYDNVGHVGNLAEEVQTANTNASNALDKATEALETSSRVYIKQIAAVDVNDYYDSELYYINNDGSTNIPVRDRGFLEVKTNDDKTACEQVFIADSTGAPYYRHGVITEQTLGEETTYVVTWSSWYQGATAEYVQAKLQDYLPLSGGNITGDLSVTGTITGNVTGNVTGNADTATNATNATNDANGDPIAGTYLPLAGGTMTGDIEFYDDLFLGSPADKTDPSQKSIFAGLYSNKTSPHDYGGIAFVNELTGTEQPRTLITAGNGTSRNFLTLYGNSAGGLSYNGGSFTDGTFLHIERVVITCTTTTSGGANVGTVTAPAVSGYKFLVWVQLATAGAIFPVYPEVPEAQTTTIFGRNTIQGSPINCYALYIRKW